MKFLTRIAIAALALYVSFPQPAISSCSTYIQNRLSNQNTLIRSQISQFWVAGLNKLESDPARNFNLGFSVQQTADPHFALRATIDKPPEVDDDNWKGAFYVAILYPVVSGGGSNNESNVILTNVDRLPVDTPKHEIIIRPDTQPAFIKYWQVRILACIGDQNQFNAFGNQPILIVPVIFGNFDGFVVGSRNRIYSRFRRILAGDN